MHEQIPISSEGAEFESKISEANNRGLRRELSRTVQTMDKLTETVAAPKVESPHLKDYSSVSKT